MWSKQQQNIAASLGFTLKTICKTLKDPYLIGDPATVLSACRNYLYEHYVNLVSWQENYLIKGLLRICQHFLPIYNAYVGNWLLHVYFVNSLSSSIHHSVFPSIINPLLGVKTKNSIKESEYNIFKNEGTNNCVLQIHTVPLYTLSSTLHVHDIHICMIYIPWYIHPNLHVILHPCFEFLCL